MSPEVRDLRPGRIPELVSFLRACGAFSSSPNQEKAIMQWSSRLSRHGCMRDDLNDLLAYAKRIGSSPVGLLCGWIRDMCWEAKLVEARRHGPGRLIYESQQAKPTPAVATLMTTMTDKTKIPSRITDRRHPCWEMLRLYRGGMAVELIAKKFNMEKPVAEQLLQVALKSVALSA